MARKPRIKSESQKQLENVEKQLDSFTEQVKEAVSERSLKPVNMDYEPQTKIAQADLAKKKEIYLKPIRSISSKEKFNEKFRAAYDFAKQHVQFIAENHEIIGESIELWTKPFAGMPAEEWKVPVNTPVFGPRYLAEQIARKYYKRLKTEDRPVTVEGGITYTGQLVIDTTIPRLDARPVQSHKSVFFAA